MAAARWRFETPPSVDLPGNSRFLEALNRQAEYFDPTRPVFTGRAPGRLDLMGGIADYSGSLVLELPLEAAAYAAVQESPEPELVVRTENPRLDIDPEAVFRLDQLLPSGSQPGYEHVRRLFAAHPRRHWAAYALGAVAVLARQRNVFPKTGLRMWIYSEVPPEVGVSSSAAVEVAAMQALSGWLGLELEGREMALLCQQVENFVAGAPCGVMDQMTAACGLEGRLLALVCQPAELDPPVVLPPAFEVWGIDSGIRHQVSGADYASVRVGAFMGYRILAELAGLPVELLDRGRAAVEDPRWNGYLANLLPSEWERLYRDRVPEQMSGADFLAQYGGITGSAARVDPGRVYPVRQPAAHPVYENNRTRLFRSLLLSEAQPEETGLLLGELMAASHQSYTACGLGSTGTDRLVELVRQVGPGGGLYGAKITGGGSGGTVAVLARRAAQTAVANIAERYQAETGLKSQVIGGSSPGARQFGAQTLVSE